MAQRLASDRGVRPLHAAVRRLAVHRTSRPSPGFARVTLISTGDGFEDDFDYLGFDQWVRLFLPSDDRELVLPEGDAEGWYARWRTLEEPERPIVRNYTIRDARRAGPQWLIDIDFVVHRSASGEVEGIAARWALEAAEGQVVGMLDQGRIFAPPHEDMPIVVVADESGVPGVEGVARSLAGREGDCLLEIPTLDDARELSGAARVTWLPRSADERPGTRVRDALRRMRIPDDAYIYAVGEAALALDARRLARTAGVPDENIDFCAYWRHRRPAALPGGR